MPGFYKWLQEDFLVNYLTITGCRVSVPEWIYEQPNNKTIINLLIDDQHNTDTQKGLTLVSK